MIVPLLILGALAVMMVFWPQDVIYVRDVTFALCQEVWDELCKAVEEAYDRAN